MRDPVAKCYCITAPDQCEPQLKQIVFGQVPQKACSMVVFYKCDGKTAQAQLETQLKQLGMRQVSQEHVACMFNEHRHA